MRAQVQADPAAPPPYAIWLELAVVAAVVGLLLSYFKPGLLFSDTVATGGDTASHVYTAFYLRDHLLPAGKIVGWCPGNLAGYPMFQIYFPLPFLAMVAFSVLMPLTEAFKLVTACGAFLFPVCAWAGLRLARAPFPAAALGAALVLPFLFNETQSMWGGNLPSLLAGEFCYSIGLALSMVFLGGMAGDVDRQEHPVRNAILLAVVGFCHGCTLLFCVVAGVVWIFAAHPGRRASYLFKVYALAFCVMGFWIVPLILFSGYNTMHNMVWIIDDWKSVLPPVLWPAIILSAAHLAWSLWRKAREGRPMGAAAWFGGMVVLAAVLYLAAFHLNVIDIRFIPFAWLSMSMWAAWALAQWWRRLPAAWALAPLVLVLSFLWVGEHVSFIPRWIQWNYDGFEATPGWGTYRAVNEFLRGGPSDPRVIYEHSTDHRRAGSTRAFESLPLFSGRSTLEGLYIQSSVSSPFIFYLQAQTCERPSTPLPHYDFGRMDLDAALPRLELFNVSQFITITRQMTEKAQAHPGLEEQVAFPPYHIFRLRQVDGSYVKALRFKPVLVTGPDWRQQAFEWFRKGDLEVPVVFRRREKPGDRQRFAAVMDRLALPLPRVPVEHPARASAKVGFEDIDLEVEGEGPLLVKMSYHPNWKLSGAEAVELASPAFMLLWPTERHVRLHFGRTWPNYLGMAMSLFACLVLAGSLPGVRHTAAVRALGRALNRAPDAAAAWCDAVLAPLTSWCGRHSALSGTLGMALLVGLCGLYLAMDLKVDYTVAYNRGRAAFEAKDWGRAAGLFRATLERFPTSPLTGQIYNHLALTYFNREMFPEARAVWIQLLERHPDTPLAPEALFHIGLCLERMGEKDKARGFFRKVTLDFPDSPWAKYSKDKLGEPR